jgi:cation:H+ antiporter
MLVFYVFIFIVSSLLLAISGSLVVDSLVGVAKHLKWREFVVGFIIMSLATSAPNLFVGINAALRGIPELSFGDVVGGNVIDLTLVLALAVFMAGSITTESRLVQTSSIFTIAIAILPLALSWDGQLDRPDGLALILAFFLYSIWLFSSRKRFRKSYAGRPQNQKAFLKNFFFLVLSLILLIAGSQGMVSSALFFAQTLNWPIGLIGVLIVGLGNCLPEIYFSFVSARKGESWMILGDLMGSVITCATLVLGVVVLIHPIKIVDFSPFLLARVFLVIACVFFLVFLRSGRKITKREGVFLLGVYIAFLLSEVFLR